MMPHRHILILMELWQNLLFMPGIGIHSQTELLLPLFLVLISLMGLFVAIRRVLSQSSLWPLTPMMK